MSTTTFTVTDLIHRCDHVLGTVRHQRKTVTITRRGRAVAIISPVPDLLLTGDPAQAAVEAAERAELDRQAKGIGKISGKSRENP